MIFRVFKLYKNVKEGTRNPTGFARDEALGLLRGAILPLTIIGALLVVLFFLLGYTTFWFGPSGFFRVLSFIASFVWFIWFCITQIILMFAKHALRRAKRSVDEKVFHHDVTPK